MNKQNILETDINQTKYKTPYSLEMINKRDKYYSNYMTIYRLLRACKGREIVFMKKRNNAHCIRGIRIDNKKWFDAVRNWTYWHFREFDYNFYISVAKYKYLPMFTMDLRFRSEETGKFFNTDFEKYCIGYDMLLDFDSEKATRERMIREIETILFLLVKYNIPRNLIYSGNNFQIIIPYEVLSLKIDAEKDGIIPFIDEIKVVTTKIKDRFNLKCLDLCGIGLVSKFRKCEFSLVDDKVCYILKDKTDLYNPLDFYDCNNPISRKNDHSTYIKFPDEHYKSNFKSFLLSHDLY